MRFLSDRHKLRFRVAGSCVAVGRDAEQAGRCAGDGELTDCMILRTLVMEVPLLTILSAIQPPRLDVTAIVHHGSTLKNPDFIRSSPRTCM